MCVVDKIIASLVLFFFEEKDTSFLCENCLFFLKVHRQMKDFLVVLVVRFSDVFFSSFIHYIYISLTCERLFFNFGSDTETLACCFTSSCFYRIFFAPKVIGASRVTALDDDDVLITR